MEYVSIYFVQSVIASAVFYSFYRFVLLKETYFTFNRIFILFSLIVSSVLPLMNFSFLLPKSQAYDMLIQPVTDLEPIVIRAGRRMSQKPHSTAMSVEDMLTYIYLAVTIVFLIMLIIKIYQIIKLIRKSEVSKYNDFTIVNLNNDCSPFSFFKYIFIGRKPDSQEDIDQIILHEDVHARQFHALDIIIMELASTLLWFNPFVWLFRKDIVEVHEFLADSEVIRSGYNIKGYQQLIYNQITGNRLFVLSSNFSKKQMKRRLTMMSKSKSGRFSLIKYLLILPVTGLVLMFYACKTDKNMPLNENDTNVFKGSPDKLPEFPGGYLEMWDFIEKNKRTPNAAKEANLTGKINVEFIVEEDGSLTNIQINCAKKADDEKWGKMIGKGCDDEAIRLVKSMPKWTPAIYKGKPVRTKSFVPVFFGSQEIWDAKNPYGLMGEALLTPEQKAYYKKLKEENKLKPPTNYSDRGLPFNEIINFIKSNIKYPESQVKNDIEGFVYATFVVDEKGNVTEPKIEKGINREFDDEVLRVIKMLPKTKPYIDENGNVIKYKYTIPVKFKLS